MEKNFSTKKTFGLAVLLKLTEATTPGIKVSENNGRLKSNVDMDKMNDAVILTMRAHNIRLVM